MLAQAEQSVREGDLEGSLSQLQDQVRKDPSDVKLRIFLFQLLAVMGRWDRAFTQLALAGEMDAGNLAMVQTYREAMKCEALRRQVFAGKGTPLVFGKPERWVALLIEALRQSAAGDHAAAQPLRDEAFEIAPATAGTIDGDPFEWIADADPRLGPVLEAIVNGAYYWVPFGAIRGLRIDPPEDLRDLVWMPAQITWTNGGGTVALIPTRYPGSEESADPAIRMARRTEWIDRGAEFAVGLGQRMFASDAGEYSLMQTQVVALDGAPDEEDPGQGAAGRSPDG